MKGIGFPSMERQPVSWDEPFALYGVFCPDMRTDLDAIDRAILSGVPLVLRAGHAPVSAELAHR